MLLILAEVLRKWPPAVVIDRTVTKHYKLKSEEGKFDLQLQPGDIVWLPVGALHHDEKYFPNPDKFDPDRFSTENRVHIDPYVYMPFGMGPRNCVGEY